MPQHKSAEKRVRQSERRRLRNKANFSKVKSVIKKVRSSTEKSTAESALKTATKVLDQMAAKGIIHKNKAASQKSKLTKHVRKVK